MITFTAIDSAVSIDLPNPILGDAEQLDIHTRFHITMSKNVHSSLIIPNDGLSTNPNGQNVTLLLTFQSIKQFTYEAFLTFYNTYRGELWEYTNYKGDKYEGYISNSPFEVTANGRYDCESVSSAGEARQVATFNVEFVGIRTVEV